MNWPHSYTGPHRLDFPAQTFDDYAPAPTQRGDIVQVPTPPQVVSHAGRAGRSFGEEYFDKFYFDPSYISSSVVASDIYHRIDFYSTYVEPARATWTDMTIIGDSVGIEVSGIEDGARIDSFQPYGFNLIMRAEGPAFFNFHVRITINGIDEYLIRGDGENESIQGFRAITWTYPINYADPVLEAYGYQTDILQAWDGSEDRVRLLDEPDFTLFNNYLLTQEQWREARNKLAGWHSGIFIVPNKNIHHVLDLITEGADTIAVPGHHFSEGGLVMLRSGDEEEFLSVSATYPDYIQLSSRVPRDMTDVEVVYCNIFYMQDSIEGQSINKDTFRVTVPFKADEERYLMNVEKDPAWLELYDGLPVLPFTHNAAQDPKVKHFYEDIGLSYPTTIRERKERSAGYDVRYTFDLVGEQIQRFKAFVHHLKGREGSFWLIDHDTAFEKLPDFGDTGTELVIAPCLFEQLGQSRLRRIAIYTPEDVYYRDIVAVQAFSDREVLTLDEALPEGTQVVIQDIRRMAKARFLQDEFEFDYTHDQLARITKAMRVNYISQP